MPDSGTSNAKNPDGISRRTALRRMGGAIMVAAAVTAGLPSLAEADEERERGAGPRVESLLGKLTLDEKLGFLHGAKDPHDLGQAGYIPGVPRLGIPPLRLADGPAGVRVTEHATALPAPVLLASTFDPALARRYGQVIGREGRALGQDVLLSPMVNLIRTPYAGRNFETFSEDPLLSSDMVVEEIGGIQGEGLIATVKHFALNNQEKDRMSIDVRADEQTMYELELRGFEAAVEAGAGSVMGSYNKVNGTPACDNKELLSGILRGRWHFAGWVMTDWYATHSTVAGMAAGLDMEMPSEDAFGAALKRAVTDGTVPEAQVDAAVRRILVVMERFGLLAAEPPPRPGRDAKAGAAVALDIAKAGATLLRNKDRTLPLPEGGSVAVVGATGYVPFVSGGGSAHVVPDRADSPYQAIKDRAGDGGSVTYALGGDIYGKALPGGALAPAVDLEERAVGAGQTWTYEGTLTVDEADAWTFVVHYSGERPKVVLDGAELFPLLPGSAEFFSGGLVSIAPDALAVRHKSLDLAAGPHRLQITAKGGDKGQTFRLRRVTGVTRAGDVADAVRAASGADHVVLFAYEDATEGQDRTSLALPDHQEALIAAVAKANPRTTVVLNSSSAITMPWLDKVGAVLQMYYPGQEGAEATAAVLYGDCDAGGRLTQSFPTSEDTHPMSGDPRRYPGVNGVEEYSERLHLGYRWYDAKKVKPLFPFGHGLSYTSFGYEDLRARWTGRGIEVSFTVRNTGKRAGVAVPQVYVGSSPDLQLDQVVRVLGGYRRVPLEAGERRPVTVRVAPRTISSWDSGRHTWVLGTGKRTVWLGASAGDLVRRTDVVVERERGK
ncbi:MULTISPECIES: beta-glucosidase [unclassified Streptomyces]|uniref:beta-glucosidase family protein n=1 Tax=unclassified Streptomyces TaxID=2593676 RepID=UPI00278C08A3|nr:MULTISPECIES: glycoside hydrolase family 3 C-terminal domain-containing protein [unclassified Streptomyces]